MIESSNNIQDSIREFNDSLASALSEDEPDPQKVENIHKAWEAIGSRVAVTVFDRDASGEIHEVADGFMCAPPAIYEGALTLSANLRNGDPFLPLVLIEPVTPNISIAPVDKSG